MNVNALGILVAAAIFAGMPMVATAKGKVKAEKLPAECVRTALTGDASHYAAMCAAQAAIRARLRDPESARFDGMYYNKRTDAICGLVAGKNGYGGYGQRMTFAMLPSGESLLLYGMPEMPIDDANNAYRDELAAYGVTLKATTEACAVGDKPGAEAANATR